MTIIFFKDIDTLHGDFLDVDPSDPAYMKVCRSLLNFVKSDNIVCDSDDQVVCFKRGCCQKKKKKNERKAMKNDTILHSVWPFGWLCRCKQYYWTHPVQGLASQLKDLTTCFLPTLKVTNDYPSLLPFCLVKSFISEFAFWGFCLLFAVQIA